MFGGQGHRGFDFCDVIVGTLSPALEPRLLFNHLCTTDKKYRSIGYLLTPGDASTSLRTGKSMAVDSCEGDYWLRLLMTWGTSGPQAALVCDAMK